MGERKTGFIEAVHSDRGGEARYTLFVPHDYDGSRDYPMILFLHGAGETGADGIRPAEVGIGPAIQRQEGTFPFLTVFPQSQLGGWRAGGEEASRALAILNEVTQAYRVDRRRVHLTGISMGGYGTWSLAQAYPGRWATIVPVCGGGDPARADRIRGLPCWCFHGEADAVVPVEESRRMVRALRAAGGRPRYTEYADIGHSSWDPAYATAELYRWMLGAARE